MAHSFAPNGFFTTETLDAYNEHGFVLVPEVLTASELAAMRNELQELIVASSLVVESDGVYDLGPGHSPCKTNVRRIKSPHTVMGSVAALLHHPSMLEILARLLGPAVRFQTSKLNIKGAGNGAPVEWHQDWAFHPHTNDDLLTVGVFLDPVDESNGPLCIVAGSHRGPVLNHHSNGYFCGAIDPTTSGVDLDGAVPLVGPAGSMSFHHVRAIHGSAPNRSDHSRNLLLLQFAAVDAFPLVGPVEDIGEFDELIVCGEPTLEPRVTAVPVRMPLPPAPQQGSIYENQRALANRYFADDGPG